MSLTVKSTKTWPLLSDIGASLELTGEAASDLSFDGCGWFKKLIDAGASGSSISQWEYTRGVLYTQVIEMTVKLVFKLCFLQKALLEVVKQYVDIANLLRNTGNTLIIYTYQNDFFYGVSTTRRNIELQFERMRAENHTFSYPAQFPIQVENFFMLPKIGNGRNVLGAFYMAIREQVICIAPVFDSNFAFAAAKKCSAFHTLRRYSDARNSNSAAAQNANVAAKASRFQAPGRERRRLLAFSAIAESGDSERLYFRHVDLRQRHAAAFSEHKQTVANRRPCERR